MRLPSFTAEASLQPSDTRFRAIAYEASSADAVRPADCMSDCLTNDCTNGTLGCQSYCGKKCGWD
jgi:hypothetical protein